MPKVYYEPELIVRFEYAHDTFSTKTYNHLMDNNLDLIDKLRECKTPEPNKYKLNEHLKCHITSGKNYKLHGGSYYKYKHKEDDIRKPNDSNFNSQERREYFDWQSQVHRDEYINAHLEEFEITTEYHSGYSNLHKPLEIKL